jgi:hypothetical protein
MHRRVYFGVFTDKPTYKHARVLYSIDAHSFIYPFRIALNVVRSTGAVERGVLRLTYYIVTDKPKQYVWFTFTHHKGGQADEYEIQLELVNADIERNTFQHVAYTRIEYQNPDFLKKINVPKQIRDFVKDIDNNLLPVSVKYSQEEDDKLIEFIKQEQIITE